jgi:hypothetical protein
MTQTEKGRRLKGWPPQKRKQAHPSFPNKEQRAAACADSAALAQSRAGPAYA